MISDESGAECGAPALGSGSVDHDLQEVLEAWTGLSKATKAGILAMVRVAGE